MTERTYCCEQNLDEPLIGTADPVAAWVLLEYRPAWTARVVEDAPLAPAIRRWLEAGTAALAERGGKVRVQFVRQPEMDRDHTRVMIGVPGALVSLAGSGYDFLAEQSLLEVIDRPQAFPRLTRPHYFVCTNGQRDLCCARFGLPVYAALRERVGERAWQVTHLGGHRFAPNVLALPQGAVYGRVHPHVVDDFLAATEAGGLAFPQLRGRAWYAPPVQAAEALSGAADLQLLEAVDNGAAGHRVRFARPDGSEQVVQVRAGEPLDVLKSCVDPHSKPVIPFRAG